MSDAVPVAILFGLLVLAFFGMWAGWRRRGRKHELPPLAEVGEATALLESDGRYFGTTVAGDWLDRVVARGLGARSDCRLTLSDAGLDVRRPTGDFRIALSELVRARPDRGIAGKVIPPHGVLVITWQHGDLSLDSGFRLTDGGHDAWVSAIERIKEHA